MHYRIQKYFPKGLLTKFAGLLAASKNKTLKNYLISKFLRKYSINMNEAIIQNPYEYASFNDFFTRKLNKNARVKGECNIVSPADGIISQAGYIQEGSIIQAKKHSYSVNSLLATKNADNFNNGYFTTIYLAPTDYHRVHMPFDATLTKCTYVPGKLFSVNPYTANNIEQLFASNERLIAYFDTEYGKAAMIMVGAMIVAAIDTIATGHINPRPNKIKHWEKQIKCKQGQEFGKFFLGSTVILIFENNTLPFLKLSPEHSIKLFEPLLK